MEVFQSLGRRLVFTFTIFSLVSVATEKKVIQTMPLVPVAVSQDGHIISVVDKMFEMVSWKKGEKKIEWSIPWAESQRTLLSTEVSAGGRYMAAYSVPGYPVRPLSPAPFSPFQETEQKSPQLYLFDMSTLSGVEIPETRIMNSAPRFSHNADAYVFAGRLDSTGWENKNVWTFNLNEYLWDANSGVQQPTGYYLEPVLYDTAAPAAASGPSSGEISAPVARTSIVRPFPGVRGTAQLNPVYSNDGTEIAMVVTTPTGARLKLYNTLTKKTEDLSAVGSVQRLEWPAGRDIYLLTYSNSGGIDIGKWNLNSKKLESIHSDQIELLSVQFSQDGKYVVYNKPNFSSTGPLLPVGSGAGVKSYAYLFDIEAKKNYQLEGAYSARFTPSGKELILAREAAAPDKLRAPFWKAKLEDLMGIAKDSNIIVANLAKSLSEEGENLLSYAPSNDDAEFKKTFKLDPLQTNGAGGISRYYYANSYLTNVSDEFYTFQFKGYQPVTCKIVDSTGAVVGESAPEGNQEYRLTLAPKRVQPLNCYVTLSTAAPASGKGKFIMSFKDLPGVAAVEAEVTF